MEKYIWIASMVQVILTYSFIKSIGKKINFLHFYIFFYGLTALVVPALGYLYYPSYDDLSKLWGWYMKVPPEMYFKHTVPSILIQYFAILYFDSSYNQHSTLDKILLASTMDSRNLKTGILLFVIAIAAKYIPNVFGPIEYILYLMRLLIYVAPLYVYFSNYKYKLLLLPLMMVLPISESLSSGMFGEVFGLLVATGVVISLKMKLTFVFKLVCICLGFSFLVTFQLIKPIYRDIVWHNNKVHGIPQGKLQSIVTLLKLSIVNYKRTFSKQYLFGPYFRFNQGMLVSMVMKHIPDHSPFQKGKDLVRLYASVIVPRLFWPNKPEAGGVYNMVHFTGYKPGKTSMDISPIGESYGNFGAFGFIYLIFYIGILSLFIHLFLKNCLFYPKLLYWAPLVFYNCLGNNSDIIYVFTGLFKSMVFVFLFYQGMRLIKVKLF